MNKTANFQLTQWEKTDRIMMEDFNRDNAAIDAALKSNADAITAEAAARENGAFPQTPPPLKFPSPALTGQTGTRCIWTAV